MSITSALTSAMSGLNASARAADVISSNLANALTPGYGRRQLDVYDLGPVSGVGINGVSRLIDEGIVADRRRADSELVYAETRARFLNGISRVIGTPEEPSSLSARLAAFEAGMIAASANPDNPASLQAAVQRAGDLTNALNLASRDIEKRRTEADGEIRQAVTQLNTMLGEIRQLNVEIQRHGAADGYAASLLDQRQSLVDRVSEMIPVRQVPRDNGAIALFTPGGAILLDGNAAQLEFTASNLVAPHMTLENGLLSGLTINGVDVAPSGPRSPIGGGRLAALFSVRDTLATDIQTQLDAIARDLAERFQQPGLDPTRAPGDPGILTDGDVAFDAANEVGLSGRLKVNALIDPAQGGAVWRLRDGLGATAPGNAGNGILISQLADALTSPRSLASGDLGGTARGASGHFATLSSRFAQDRLTIDQALSFASVRQSELASLEQENGVDSDAELQNLLLIEQAYGKIWMAFLPRQSQPQFKTVSTSWD